MGMCVYIYIYISSGSWGLGWGLVFRMLGCEVETFRVWGVGFGAQGLGFGL